MAMAALGVGNLSLSPLCFEDMPCESPSKVDAKGSCTVTSKTPTDSLRVIRTLPSPARMAPGPVSPLGPVCSPMGPAGSPLGFARNASSEHASPLQMIRQGADSEQVKILQTRCSKAEQQQGEALARVASLEHELQELRAKLAASGDRAGAKAQALWKAAEGAVGETEEWQEVRTKHEEWFAEAQSNLDQRHCAQIWRLLRENYSVSVLSNIAQVVGEGAVCVGRLLFDTTSNQTASVQKVMGASQAIMETVLERQHRKSSGNEMPTSQIEGVTQKPPAGTLEKRPVRSLSRPAFQPKARMPPGTPSETQVRPQVSVPPRPPTETLLRPVAPAVAHPEVSVPPRLPHTALAANEEVPACQRALRSASTVPSLKSPGTVPSPTTQQSTKATATGAPTRSTSTVPSLQSPGTVPSPTTKATATGAQTARFRMSQSPSIRDRMKMFERS